MGSCACDPRFVRTPRDETAAIQTQPGLYALYGSEETWESLDLGSPPDDRPLYVGKAEASLVSRDPRTHFKTGRTGQSSPRRSLASLLANELQLVAMPRRPEDPEPKKWTHFALELPGDVRLTEWMLSHLKISIWVSPPGTHLGVVESEIMQRWLPPLNLSGCSTPWTSQIRDTRSTMANQAKVWARNRGFDVP